MSHENFIVKVGNILPQLREAFESYKADGDERSPWPSKLCCTMSRMLEDTMLNMCKELAEEQRYSWFSSNLAHNDYSCTRWHFDTLGKMIISSYPNPTQFLIYEDEINLVSGCMSQNNDNTVKELVEKGKATIFTPEVGDVYLAKNFKIHRTNPKSRGAPHLVARVWLK